MAYPIQARGKPVLMPAGSSRPIDSGTVARSAMGAGSSAPMAYKKGGMVKGKKAGKKK